ncbi:hypothetical protein [Aliivibrio fischeri]|uniref:Uncharacterized protein n=1 Tax=Aliivibrio fischeri (strain MJ11) TaxID=388396 RepID=B5EV18_ALIFM|nr:hypothetical protein [Aliivibrio fischeri]ACH64321.1 conserved hypothetical protein [Aliivibrio fischeri MJ11]OCH07497.1 hypothetical protein A6E11_14905 [Aliivibrio fischeri]OCH27698.1 hypothetical protein A6E13_08100 [Aliivibrio fischeri]
MARLGMVIQLVLASSIFYLGYTIYSFTHSINTVVDQYPELMKEVNKTADKLEIEQWLLLAQHLEELTPQALELVSEVKNTINNVNQTVASVDSKIPLILNEVQSIRTESLPEVITVMNAVNKETVPNTLIELKNYREQVFPKAFVESKGYRITTIPAVLKESEKLRKEVPPIMLKADQIIDKTEELSQQATQGAVKGVIMSPFNLLKEAGNEIQSKVNE